MTVKLIIVEGARGTGKSKLTQHLRSTIWGATIMNPTGFSDDGYPGLKRIETYYDAIFEMLDAFQDSKHEHVVVLDRFFFSEQVYSKLYKSYDFTQVFWYYLDKLLAMSEVHVILLESTDKTLLKRLKRDKAELFDQVKDTVDESIRQQIMYLSLFREMSTHLGRIKYDKVFHTLLTDQFESFEELATEVKTIIAGESNDN